MTITERLQHYSLSVEDHLLWCGTLDREGYGKLSVEGEMARANRVAWGEAYGPIPDGLHVLHLCDTPPCIEPEHLYLGTDSDNTQDRDTAGHHHEANRTHCPQGHPYNEANTYIAPGTGYRNCRTCRGQNPIGSLVGAE
ncbi:hypothetical protein LCGC14_2280410 [marine sediment metagenome]|uniref:HNH nuclease domain-containing protein n=1 Tax=marine sediment metagenome TaxID=412755 RepID=A0A0F9CUT2_9ZZZZ